MNFLSGTFLRLQRVLPHLRGRADHSKGASLLEIIIATGIVGLVMTSTVAIMTVSLKTTSLSRNKSVATKYTQEGIEYFRTQRNIMGWETFFETLNSGGVTSEYCMATLPYTETGGLEELPNRPCTSSEFVDENDVFQRYAEVTTDISGENGSVHVTVSTVWEDNGRELTSTATLELGDIYVASNFELTFPSPQIPTPVPTPSPVPSPDPCEVNIVQGKTTSQSSSPITPGASSLAADGNTDGDWNNGSVSHTAEEANAWWQVDLGQSYNLSDVDIYNRTDGTTATRLSNYHVLISEFPFISTNLATTISSFGVDDFHQTTTAGSPTTIAANTTGRYLRVQQSGTNYLHMAEVEAFGCATDSYSNVALNKSAAQSSTNSGADASRAVDGNTNGNWAGNSVSHTNSDANAWWQVDLGAVYDLSHINIYNRTDCCGTRLSNFYIFVSDVPFTSTNLSTTLAQSGVSSYYISGAAGSPTQRAFGRTGRYVRIQLSGTDYLHMAEVEIYGKNPGGSPGPSPSPTPSLAGYWKFDEGTGSTVADSSSNGNTGTWLGSGVHWAVTGLLRSAGRFNGSGDTLNIGTRDSLNFGNNGPFTFEGWVKPSTLVDYAGFISKDASRNTPYSYMTAFMANGRMVAYNGSAWADLCPAGSVQVGVWQHVAFSYNGTTLTGYINGSSCGSISFTYVDNPAHTVVIGSWYSPSSVYDYIGTMDEVKIYRGALTADEILDEYDSSADTMLAPTADWPFSEGSGTTVADITGNGHNGTWSGSGTRWTTAGVSGNAGIFNGTNDTISVPLAGIYDNFTLEMWVNPTGTITLNSEATSGTTGISGQRYAWWNGNPGTTGASALLSVGTNGLSVYEHAANYMPPLAVSSNGVSGWKHVAVVYKSKVPSIYVNGVLVRTGLTSPRTTVEPFAGGVAAIGGGAYGYFSGKIDEVKLYDYARSASQIADSYSANAGSGSQAFDPVAKWSFNEGTGTSVADSSGNGNTGTWFGSEPHWGSLGVSGGAGRFTYSNGVNIAVSSTLNMGNNGPFSIEGWVRPNLSDYAGFVSKNTNRFTPYAFMSAFMKNGRLMIYNTTIGWIQVCPPGSVSAGTWQHVALTYDGATVRGYVNGSLCGSNTFSYTDVSTANVNIGSWYSGVNNYDYLGLMDEISFYNYARSASQIATDASAFTPPADTWAYRRPITIANSTGTTLTNYPILITMDTTSLINAGKMNGDCSDLRFSDGSSKLSYWLQEGQLSCIATTKSVWIKVPTIPPSGTTIYAYYGSPGADGESNGSNVFEFFDDFNGAALDTTKWTATGANSITNGSLIITTGAVYSNSPVASTTQNRMFEMHAAWAATQTAYAGIQISNAQSIAGSNGNSNKLAMFMSAGTIAQTAWGATGVSASYNIVAGTALYTPTANTYTLTGFGYSPSALSFFGNRAQVGTYANTVQYAPYLILGYFTGSAAGTTDGTDLSVNFVIVRQYVTPEPTPAWGTETSGSWSGL
ncbi:DUF2341 domain-containing protein [Patescibacteria group bacterium]|nr:DUF2341 domain-containing protein [Patescibacteria group bacterium]